MNTIKTITEATENELILELANRFKERGKFLNSEANNKIIKSLEDGDDEFNFALTYGLPDTLSHDRHKCSRCNQLKTENNFSFYKSRIGSDGYLMRSNALCTECAKSSNKRRQQTLQVAHDNGEIPEMPKSGDTCPHCQREWHGKWHRHHDDVNHKFIDWLCGNCNMSFHDQRTPK